MSHRYSSRFGEGRTSTMGLQFTKDEGKLSADRKGIGGKLNGRTQLLSADRAEKLQSVKGNEARCKVIVIQES